MLGALIGDVVGSVFERSPHKSKDFDAISELSRFTDDTIMSVAVADALVNGYDYATALKYWGRGYPDAGYGSRFKEWLTTESGKRGESYGNGSAMRVSPVGWAFNSLEKVMGEAKKSAVPSHNHPEAIKGARAVASSVYLARKGKSKEQIRAFAEKEFGYDLSRSLDEIRPSYKFDATCKGSVPEAIIAFLESSSFGDAVCNAVSLGGDADTQACIAGSIAEAFYGGVSKRDVALLKILLPRDALQVVEAFNEKYMKSRYNFFCCGREATEGRPAGNDIPREALALDASRRRWWVRNYEADGEVWAFAAEQKEKKEISVYFSTDAPVIFDELRFNSFEDAFLALSRNGFDLFKENYGASGDILDFYGGSPRGRFAFERHAIFSEGDAWE